MKRKVGESNILIVPEYGGGQIQSAELNNLSVFDAQQKVFGNSGSLRGGVHVTERYGQSMLLAVGIKRRNVYFGVHVEKRLGEGAEKPKRLLTVPSFDRYNLFAVTCLHVC